MRVDYSAATKAHAMFGKRLLYQDYQEITRKSTVVEIASYLKNQTYYRDILEGVNEHTIHRGYLELLIRQNYFYRFGKLLHYSIESKEFIRFGIMNVEYQLIMTALYTINDEDRSGMIAQLPMNLNSYTSFDMEQLIEAKNLDDILDLIQGTPYYIALKEYKGIKNKDLDIPACELALRNAYTNSIIRLIDTHFAGDTAKELYEIFVTQLELNNIAKIYRLKKYYKVSPMDIKKSINIIDSRISEKTMLEWIENCSAEEVLEQLQKSSYRSFTKGKEFIYIENYLSWIEYQVNMRHMRFSGNSEVIIICYMNLLQFEISNLVNIIEGVRYHVTAEKVMQLLVY